MQPKTINEKKIKLVKLVIILSLIYSSSLAILDSFGITQYIEYRTPLMVFYALCNIGLLLTIRNSKTFDIKIAYTVLGLALFIFTTTMIIYPPSEIRVMWYFFTIMIAYYVGGQRVGHVVALASVVLVFIANAISSMDFSSTTMANVIIGILFISQISNYFVSILDKNEQDLLHSNKKIQQLLNNAGQGFLYFNSDMKIGAEYSKEAKRIFGVDLEDKDILQLLYSNDEDARDFNKATLQSILSEDEMKQEILISLLKKEFVINSNFIDVEYKVLDKDTFMMVLTDVTTKKELAQKIKDEQQVLKMVIEIVTTKEQFMELKSDYENFITTIEQYKSLDHLADLRREIHTYKGLFAQKEMLHIVKKLHNFESTLDENIKKNILGDEIKNLDTKTMQEWLELDLDVVKDILGNTYFNKSNYIEINTYRIDKLYKKVDEYLNHDINRSIITDDIRDLKYNNIKIFFRPYEKLVNQLSIQLDKPMYPLKTDIEDIYMPDKYIPFLNSLVHIFRNSMDHGIEDIETRYELEKDEQGLIDCQIKKENDNLIIQISDDGRGVNPEIIANKAIEKGIYTKEQLEQKSEDEIVQIIFEDSFSTSDNITNLSGRGVGLASILSELNKINGTMTIQNRFNHGIKFEFIVPMDMTNA